MGEVYAAEDTRLRRTVALKVLPEALASDPERIRRFEREARTVASLNHPNIVTIYSVEEADGVRFLTEARAETGLPVVTEVMEPNLVEMVALHADILQVGARNMQNFTLLHAVGES